jgi:hypothetical protein
MRLADGVVKFTCIFANELNHATSLPHTAAFVTIRLHHCDKFDKACCFACA